MHRLERGLVVVVVLGLVALPTAVHGWPTDVDGNLVVLLALAGGLALAGWRDRPRTASVTTLALFLAASTVDGWLPDTAVVLFSAGLALLALSWSGRAAWVVAACVPAYLTGFFVLSGMQDWVPVLIATVPPYVAGTVLRLRRETADQLALRARELEEERELFVEIAVRHERARIASELHDVVGHAVSVMVIQAAAGQRLVDVEPDRARAAFAAISESARRGSQDLERLVELLGGATGPPGAGDLALVDELVARAGRNGLEVACVWEGDQTRVSPAVAHLAVRVVQESLTNALRHAPGAGVRVLVRVDKTGRGATVRVENGRSTQPGPALVGTGRGLVGLHERIRTVDGTFGAGPTTAGGWAVEARLPLAP